MPCLSNLPWNADPATPGICEMNQAMHCESRRAAPDLQRRLCSKHSARFVPYQLKTISENAQLVMHQESICTTCADAVLWHLVSKLSRVRWVWLQVCSYGAVQTNSRYDAAHAATQGLNNSRFWDSCALYISCCIIVQTPASYYTCMRGSPACEDDPCCDVFCHKLHPLV
jgi:hypothetical protein